MYTSRNYQKSPSKAQQISWDCSIKVGRTVIYILDMFTLQLQTFCEVKNLSAIKKAVFLGKGHKYLTVNNKWEVRCDNIELRRGIDFVILVVSFCNRRGDFLGNKVRKILELEMNTPTTKSHTIFTVNCEYRTAEQTLIRSQIQFYNVAGLNHAQEQDVSKSLKSLETSISQSVSNEQVTG